MAVTSSLAQQLQQLRNEPGDRLPSGPGTGQYDGPSLEELTLLVRELQRVVPSLLAVSLVRTRFDVAVPLTLMAPADRSRQARASLAVALATTPGCTALLVVQAAAPGAFLLLVDQLETQHTTQPGTAVGPALDEHLVLPPPDANSALAASLSDLTLVDQATGVLIGRGLTPEEALTALRQHAVLASTSLTAASRALLSDLPQARRPDPPVNSA